MSAVTARRAVLEEERDLLLRSLDDLEVEYEQGDLTEDDFQALHDDYTARAATVMRQLDRLGEAGSNAQNKDQDQDKDEDGPPRPLSRTVLVGAGLLVFAVVAGLALGQALGERGVNDQITGGIDESTRGRVARCQEQGSTGGDLLGSIQCFDEVLADDPTNAEALGYRGWYLVLAAGALQQTTDETDSDEAIELIAGGLSYLDRAIEADPTYPDPLAFRAVVYDRLGEGDRACADVATLVALDPPPFFINQTSGIVERNGCTTE